MPAERDAVDAILDQWSRERPDLDASPMGIIGRLSRLERRLDVELCRVFATHGLERWEFDMLATLRRAGDPFELSVGAMLDSMMIASGTATHRIDRLEQRALLRRRTDPDDRRVVRVALTAAGRRLVDAALRDHVANEARLLSGLTDAERARLAALLRRLTLTIDALSG